MILQHERSFLLLAHSVKFVNFLSVFIDHFSSNLLGWYAYDSWVAKGSLFEAFRSFVNNYSLDNWFNI